MEFSVEKKGKDDYEYRQQLRQFKQSQKQQRNQRKSKRSNNDE